MLLALALVASHLSAAEPPEWFRSAKFGVYLDRHLDPQVWMPRIAASGARYVVADEPTDAMADAADAHKLLLLRSSAYANIGALLPSQSQPRVFESRFDVPLDALPRDLIRLLIEVVSKGGNLLLRLPPAKPDAAIAALEGLGAWLRKNGSGIYGAGPSPLDRTPFFGRATMSGNTLNLFLYAWPRDGKLRLQSLGIEKLTGDFVLPPAARDASASLIKIPLPGPPKVRPYIITPDHTGVLTARAEASEWETKPGLLARKDLRNGVPAIVNWIRAIDVPTWKVRIPADGRYAVEAVYAAGKESAGVVYTITLRGYTMGMVKGVVAETGPMAKPMPVSEMELDAGDYILYVQPENKPGQPAMALEAVRLRRVNP